MAVLSSLSPAGLNRLWTSLPVRARWVVCWPLLAGIYLASFQITAILADALLQTILRIPPQTARVGSPVLADVLHMALMLPAIRLLVPARQHVVIFGFAAVVLLASVMAFSQFLSDRMNASAESWRSTRDLVNCLVVLALVSWYGVRLMLAARVRNRA